MTQAAKAQEPSMEEILASIRRIIADDDDAAKPQCQPTLLPPKAASLSSRSPPSPQPTDSPERQAPHDAPPPESEPPAHHDVLELSEAMADPEPTRPAFRTIQPQRNVVFDEFRTTAPLRAAEPPLLSEASAAAVHSAFGALEHTLPVQNAKTLEELVREMLRPMLKAWLDDNLPTLVERLVRAEIERVARGQNQR